MSKFIKALEDFGFKTKEEQVAFVQNLYFAGYFKEENIWQMINLMEHDKSGARVTNIWDRGEGEETGKVDEIFLALANAVNRSKLHQGDFTKCDFEKFLTEFGAEKSFDGQDLEDIILHMGQSAFNRSQYQERSELSAAPWTETCDQTQYQKNAQIIGLIDKKEPEAGAEFDQTWVQGAAKLRTKTRLEHLKEMQDSGVKVGEIKFLTGDRELWLEIDKYPGESEEEKRAFFINLAEKNGIRLTDEEEKFETRAVGSTTRTYLKYHPDESRKITETMMAKQVFEDVFGYPPADDLIIDSAADAAAGRATTLTGAKKAASELKLSEAWSKTEVKIMIVSDQPYADRQLLANKRACSEVLGDDLDKITFSAAGRGCEVGVRAINSEMGALTGERYYEMIRQRGDKERKRNPEQLMFRNRCNNPEIAMDMVIVGLPSPSVAALETEALQQERKEQVR